MQNERDWHQFTTKFNERGFATFVGGRFVCVIEQSDYSYRRKAPAWVVWTGTFPVPEHAPSRLKEGGFPYDQEFTYQMFTGAQLPAYNHARLLARAASVWSVTDFIREKQF